MTVPKINSSHGAETRNIINAAIDSINVHGKAIQDLVAEGQLTERQYFNLIQHVNGLINEEELISRLNDVASGSPKGAYNTLSSLTSAHPNGADGIYVVTENGQWYYWNDEWLSGGVYQSTQWQNALTTQNEDWVI